MSCIWVNPCEVRFTQVSCSNRFRSGLWLSDAYWDITLGSRHVRDFPPIQVVWYRGQLWSLNNRRLALWQALHMSSMVDLVPCYLIPHPRGEYQARRALLRSRRFDTPCQGQLIIVRGAWMILGSDPRDFALEAFLRRKP